MLNKKTYVREALKCMPKAPTTAFAKLYRHDIPRLLPFNNNVGIELGVATGHMSKRLLDTGKFRELFGVDVYGDSHNTDEYIHALKTIGIDANYKLVRLKFEQALRLFPNEYFDFIYIDGFAHTGENAGATIVDWYQKLKIGGILSGDDYHADWPLVMWAVNRFVTQTHSELNLTNTLYADNYSEYPSWFIHKTRNFDPTNTPLDPRLQRIAELEEKRIHRIRTSRTRKGLRVIRRVLGFRAAS